MPGPGLISDYLRELSAQLPGQVVEELADGLNDTCEHYLNDGLDPDAAASAALAEFGDPQVIIAAFTRLSSPQRAARRLLLTGPSDRRVLGGGPDHQPGLDLACPERGSSPTRRDAAQRYRPARGRRLRPPVSGSRPCRHRRMYRYRRNRYGHDHHGRFCHPCAALASHPGPCGQRSPPRLHHTDTAPNSHAVSAAKAQLREPRSRAS
jgi:hypothetical protein